MSNNATRRTVAVAALSTLAFLLSACGSGMDMSSMSSSTTSAPNGQSAGPATASNAQDVMFAQMMIVHHKGAIDMAKLAPSRAQSAEVKALAAKIEAAQAPEITQMEGWLQSWGEPASMSQDAQHSMAGAMSESDMTALSNASGSAFDKQFLTMMTAHHNGAIEMAKTEQASGQYQPAKDLASAIVTSQSAEVAEMAELLKRV